MGPKTDHCGTPQVKPVGLEVTLPVLTVWVVRLKYEANHVRGTLDRPTLSERRVSNTLWSTVLETALKHDARWLSTAVSRLLWILIFIYPVVCYRQTPWYHVYVLWVQNPLFPAQLLQARQFDLSVTSTPQSVNRWSHIKYSCCSIFVPYSLHQN